MSYNKKRETRLNQSVNSLLMNCTNSEDKRMRRTLKGKGSMNRPNPEKPVLLNYPDQTDTARRLQSWRSYLYPPHKSPAKLLKHAARLSREIMTDGSWYSDMKPERDEIFIGRIKDMKPERDEISLEE